MPSEYGVAAQARRPARQGRVRPPRPAHHLRASSTRSRTAPRTCCTRAASVPNARLGIALANRPEWFVAALGAARLGAQCVPIPSGATADERDVLLHRRRGRVPPRRGRRSPEFLAALDAAPAEPYPDAAPDYVQLRAYTSGTTGPPEGGAAARGRRRREHRGSGALLHRVRARRARRGERHRLAAAPPRRVQRPAQRAAARPHHRAARPLRRRRVVRRGDRVRRHVLVDRAGAPLPADERARRREGRAPTCRRSSACCTARRRARRASSAR